MAAAEGAGSPNETLNSPSREAFILSTVHASIIITCKGRFGHLRATLPNMLAQQCDFPYEVIVVDYGCPQHAFDWCVQLNHARLLALRVVDNARQFNLSRARNCGARYANSEILAFVDADVFLSPHWLGAVSRELLQHGLVTVGRVGRGIWDCFGSCAVRTDLFHQVRGYNEAFHGWGRDDVDFYRRCTQVASVGYYGPHLVRAIQHSHAERSRHYDVADIWASNAANARLAATSGREVNPSGYGLCKAVQHRGSMMSDPLLVPVKGTRHQMGLRA
ncbi:glycosyltransferase family 2 protein [Planctomycetales bacterium ZRK34]|nr:glycosyltransferase family 2 protein [Planctomycetales bacterium ZRK34]